MSTQKKSADIIGKTVVNGDGFIIGEVNDYLIDLENWQVTDLQVKIDKATAKELGLKAPFFGALLVLVDVHQIRSTTDQVIIKLAVDEFQEYVDERKKEAKRKDKDKGKDEPEEAPAETDAEEEAAES